MSTAVGALPRRLLVLIAALLLAAASVVSTAAPAAAHDRLLGSDPAAESTVEQLPTTLSLTFSAAIAADAGASEVQVTDAAGAALTDGAPVVDGPILSQPLTQVTTAGPVTVLWKVVSSDGHPISGEFTFTVTSTPPAPTPTDTPTPTETLSATSSPETPTESATPVPTDTDAASDSSSYVPWIIAAVLGALVVAATAYLIASRARRRRDGSQPPHPESEDPTDR